MATINCPNCQSANRDTARFCMQCGRSLTARSLGNDPTYIEDAQDAATRVQLPDDAPTQLQDFAPQDAGQPTAINPVTPSGLQTGMLPPNTHLQNRYVIVGRLGRGGMGAVYEAIDARITGKDWAVKEMSSAALLTPQEQQQALSAFRREAEMLARLSHPNLPAVTDFFSQGGKQYLVMERVRGKTLEELLHEQKTPFTEAQVLNWADQLCQVLDYLHNQHPPIIFRDLKPANIMLDEMGRIKLIDFGIARLFRPEKTTDTQAMGTPGYAAPEQYGHGQTDARSDVYALGATLHALLSRRDPGQSPFIFPRLRSLNPDVSTNTEAVIHTAVETKAERRFSTIAQMRSALHGQAQPAQPNIDFQAPFEAPEQNTKPGRGRTSIFAGIGIALIILLCVGAVGTYAVVNFLNTPTPIPPIVDAVTETPTSPPQPDDPTDTPDAQDPTDTPSPPAPDDPTLTPTITPEPDAPTNTPTSTPEPPTFTPTPVVEEYIIGRSFGGRDIDVVQIGTGSRSIVLVGGLHAGFAPSSVTLADNAIEYFTENPDEVPDSVSLYIIPNANPDSNFAPGLEAGRLNDQGVDLNRNFGCNWSNNATWRDQPIDPGTGAFSEPETVAFRDFIFNVSADAVVFYEARASNGLVAPGNCNGNDGGGDALASLYVAESGYPLYTGFSLTGDGSDWLASQNIPAVAILLTEYDTLSNGEWFNNLDAILAILEAYS